MDAAAWDERYAATELVWSAGPNQFVEQALTDLPPGRALDLACGEGRNARWLAEQGWQVTAMDFSPVAIEKGRRLAEELADDQADRIDWQVGDVLDTPLPADLDLVVIAYLQVVADGARNGDAPRIRRARAGRPPVRDRARLDQPHRGHRRAARTRRALHRRGRAGRPRGRATSRWCGPSGWRAPSPLPTTGSTSTAWDALVHVVRSVTPTQLRAFACVVRHGSVKGAARSSASPSQRCR